MRPINRSYSSCVFWRTEHLFTDFSQKTRAIALPGVHLYDMVYFTMKRCLSLLLILLLLLPLPVLAAEGEGDAPLDPSIKLVPEEGLPLPCEAYHLTEKRSFVFGGTVTSAVPLSSVSVTVSDQKGALLLSVEAEIDPEDEDATAYPLWDRTYPFEDESLSARTNFASLKPGKYVFTLKAANAIAGEVVLYTSPFTVERTTALHTLIPNDLRGTYYTAEAYLGKGILPFTYRTGTFGQLQIDNRWVSRNIVEVNTPFDGPWKVNKAAAEPFKKAISYLRNTYIHVGGKWDSGILRLARLVASYSGPYTAREEEYTPFLSPHVLGLAVDLNGSIGLNDAVPDNWVTFCQEISENLIYNGIREKNGYRYYDFTYIGNWGTAYERVPTIIQNYLLYELAFYRAGFFWGVYYDHTCDAKHFGLGEYDPSVHTDSPLALRKVFEYIDE